MARGIPFRASLLVLGLPLLCPAAEIGRPAVLWDRPLHGEVYGSAVAGDTVVLLTLKPGASDWTIEGRQRSPLHRSHPPGQHATWADRVGIRHRAVRPS